MYQLFTDGGARGNPGKAAFGCVLFDKNLKLIDFNAKYLGTMTNNQSEYEAILAGLQLAQTHNVEKIKCFLDSELIVKQINGEYKVRNGNIKHLFEKLKLQVDDFKDILFFHIRREQNSFADKLVNIILDAVD